MSAALVVCVDPTATCTCARDASDHDLHDHPFTPAPDQVVECDEVVLCSRCSDPLCPAHDSLADVTQCADGTSWHHPDPEDCDGRSCPVCVEAAAEDVAELRADARRWG